MRRFRAVLVLGLCACVAAGCGSSLVQTADQQSRLFLGDPYPRFMSVEFVRNVNGDQEAVIPVQGHFTIRPDCPALVGGAAARCRTTHPRYAVLEFSLPDPKAGSGFWSISASQIAAIAAARRADPLFSLFPDFTGEIVRCSIPRGTPAHGTIAGTCSTNTVPFRHVRRVELVEHWPLSERSGTRNKAGWVVALGRDGGVRSIHVVGQPPQLSH
ncbi:MAG TPA: hypothetical protein VJ716_10020 [Gaiellaceae bacterium]|nr:hypothetical protein [Gaiellaceae bacterium]